MSGLILALGEAYSLIIIVYVLLSWLPTDRGILKDVNDVLARVCDPYLNLFKRIVPPMSNEIITLVKDTSIARIISFQEVIWAGYAFLKGSHGYSGLIWPLFFTAVYYLIFSGVVTLLLGRLEKKLDYFR